MPKANSTTTQYLSWWHSIWYKRERGESRKNELDSAGLNPKHL